MNPEPHTTNEGLAGKILARIEHEGVTVRPRWHFVFSNGFFWTMWGLSVAVGAVAVAATVFSFVSIGWQFYAATHDTLFEFVVESLPYVWMVLLVMFVLVSYENMRHTKRGYRYPLSLIVGASVVASISLGVALFLFGVGRLADRGLERNLPAFSNAARMEDRWVEPEKGLLAGEVSSVGSSTAFGLRDFEGGQWEIRTEDLAEQDLAVLDRSDRVRLVGVPTEAGAHVFHACLVFPWEPQKRTGPGSVRDRRTSPSMMERLRERNAGEVRSNGCEGVRPYELLRKQRDR